MPAVQGVRSRVDISVATWDSLSKLLDEALDLDEEAREAWLEDQASSQPERAAAVRKLLAAHATSETDDLLARLPAVDRGALGAERALRRIWPPACASARTGLLRELGTGGMAEVWLAERADGAFERAGRAQAAARQRTATRPRVALRARAQHPARGSSTRTSRACTTPGSAPRACRTWRWNSSMAQPIDRYCDDAPPRRRGAAARCSRRCLRRCSTRTPTS